MKIIFISGATGFIGQRLVKAIDSNVRVLSREKKSDYETVVCDLKSEVIPDNTLDGVGTVFHLAGFAHDLNDATKIQNIYQKVNVSATVQLANLAVKSGVKRFVFVSSVKAGGNPPLGTCANEKDQKNTEDVYGKTKREAELKLLEIGKESGMHVSIVRPSLVYGPNVKGNLKLMLSGIEKRWFPPLPETGNRRSMIHVDDLVMSIVYVSKHESSNNEIYIATDGRIYSSDQIYDLMCIELGNRIPKWRVPRTLFIFSFFGGVNFRRKIKKLFGDECYSSSKLESIGFSAKKTFEDFNESDF